MTEGRGQGSHRRINYIYNKKKLFSLFFILHQLASSKHQSKPDSWTRKYPTRSHFLEIHLKNNNSKKVWLSSTLSKNTRMVRSVELKLFRSALSHVWVTVRVWELRSVETSFKTKNHRAADSPPGVCVEARVVRFGGGEVTNIDSVFLDWWDLKKHICIFFIKKNSFLYHNIQTLILQVTDIKQNFWV